MRSATPMLEPAPARISPSTTRASVSGVSARATPSAVVHCGCTRSWKRSRHSRLGVIARRQAVLVRDQAEHALGKAVGGGVRLLLQDAGANPDDRVGERLVREQQDLFSRDIDGRRVGGRGGWVRRAGAARSLRVAVGDRPRRRVSRLRHRHRRRCPAGTRRSHGQRRDRRGGIRPDRNGLRQQRSGEQRKQPEGERPAAHTARFPPCAAAAPAHTAGRRSPERQAKPHPSPGCRPCGPGRRSCRQAARSCGPRC